MALILWRVKNLPLCLLILAVLTYAIMLMVFVAAFVDCGVWNRQRIFVFFFSLSDVVYESVISIIAYEKVRRMSMTNPNFLPLFIPLIYHLTPRCRSSPCCSSTPRCCKQRRCRCLH